MDDMYDVSTWRLVASQGSGGAWWGHPLWLNGLAHCQRVDNGVSPWMLCTVSG